jgi:hypothetical protein
MTTIEISMAAHAAGPKNDLRIDLTFMTNLLTNRMLRASLV